MGFEAVEGLESFYLLVLRPLVLGARVLRVFRVLIVLGVWLLQVLLLLDVLFAQGLLLLDVLFAQGLLLLDVFFVQDLLLLAFERLLGQHSIPPQPELVVQLLSRHLIPLLLGAWLLRSLLLLDVSLPRVLLLLVYERFLNFQPGLDGRLLGRHSIPLQLGVWPPQVLVQQRVLPLRVLILLACVLLLLPHVLRILPLPAQLLL